MAEEVERRRTVTHDDLRDTRREFREEMRELHTELKDGMQALARSNAEAVSSLSSKIDAQKKPLADYAPVGVLLMALVGAVLAPLYAADAKFQKAVDQQLALDRLEAEVRGAHSEKFATIELAIESALENRRAELDKQTELIRANAGRIEEVNKTLDNGLGRRMAELLAPVAQRVDAVRELGLVRFSDLERRVAVCEARTAE